MLCRAECTWWFGGTEEACVNGRSGLRGQQEAANLVSGLGLPFVARPACTLNVEIVPPLHAADSPAPSMSRFGSKSL